MRPDRTRHQNRKQSESLECEDSPHVCDQCPDEAYRWNEAPALHQGSPHPGQAVQDCLMFGDLVSFFPETTDTRIKKHSLRQNCAFSSQEISPAEKMKLPSFYPFFSCRNQGFRRLFLIGLSYSPRPIRIATRAELAHLRVLSAF